MAKIERERECSALTVCSSTHNRQLVSSATKQIQCTDSARRDSSDSTMVATPMTTDDVWEERRGLQHRPRIRHRPATGQ